jgi:Na+-transporting methylmalonyl-CoA/oxaloacetate decarboxylase gamma subunit
MNRRHIIIVLIVLAILALTVWRGCSKLPKQVASPKLSPDSTSGHIDPKLIREPETKEEYEAKKKGSKKGVRRKKGSGVALQQSTCLKCSFCPHRPMPCAIRYQYPGAVYHLMARGDGGKVIFENDEDRKALQRDGAFVLPKRRV